ncbi:hypothetical protein [Actinocorallia aurantiaca]|uniref:Uncharacterized protein n=1 Tax=Actinocorallia aurantiaca TaxID=46204 RepID=A0ABP6GGM8_9ACTN
MSAEPALDEETLRTAVELLSRVTEGFTEELGGEPALGELLEIIAQAVPFDSELVEGARLPVRFKAELARGRRYTPPADSRTAELNDNTFAEASSLVSFLTEHFAPAGGKHSSYEFLGPLLLQVLHSAETPLADLDPRTVSGLAVEHPKGKPGGKPGDIVAIPAKNGLFRFAVLVARNQFGLALGFLEGASRVPRPKPPLTPGAVFYTDDLLITSGDWPVVARDEHLLALFPAEPEIYHGTDLAFPGVSVGEFGAAETPSGELREIDEDEARAVGLLDGTYQQAYMSSHLQRLLLEGSLPGVPHET